MKRKPGNLFESKKIYIEDKYDDTTVLGNLYLRTWKFLNELLTLFLL